MNDTPIEILVTKEKILNSTMHSTEEININQPSIKFHFPKARNVDPKLSSCLIASLDSQVQPTNTEAPECPDGHEINMN